MSAKDRGGWNLLLSVVLAGAAWCWPAQPAWAELVRQTIYTSAASQTTTPYSALVQANDGNFYGTAPTSSFSSDGTVFRVTPAGAMQPVVLFQGSNGSEPKGGLLLAADGNLYGTTMLGGLYSVGTLFKLTATGFFQSLHSFSGSDGTRPYFSLIQARDGFLYGVTVRSSTNFGTIFRATTAGAVTTLTNFASAMPGLTAEPTDGLVEGPDGWLYGTTMIASTGSQKIGSIFKISTNGLFQTLVYFETTLGSKGMTVGDRPVGGLTVGTDGFLYGTIGHDYSAMGTSDGWVFRMTTNGVLSKLVSFAGTNGSNPMTRMRLANDDSFYGLTTGGGPSGAGTIFRVTTNGVLTTVAGGFGANSVYEGPPALIQARDGNIYGTGMVSTQSLLSALAFRLVSPPLITAAAWSGSKLTLTWNSFTNGAYRLAYKSQINGASWTTQASTITATGAVASASDTPGIAAQRFYQVVLLP